MKVTSSTQRRARLTTQATPAHPLGPVSSSGIRKSKRLAHARKSQSSLTIQPKRHGAKAKAPQRSVRDLTTSMANLTVSKTAKKPPKRPNKLHESPKKRTSLNSLPAPAANLPPPPTKIEELRATASEPDRQKPTVLNCRYRVPNTYLTVYHRQGRVMLCRPWEEPWLNGANEGCGWL